MARTTTSGLNGGADTADIGLLPMADHHTQNDHTLARLPAHAPSPVVRGNGPQPFSFYRDYGASGEKVTKCSTERYVATKGDGCRVQASWSVRSTPPGSHQNKQAPPAGFSLDGVAASAMVQSWPGGVYRAGLDRGHWSTRSQRGRSAEGGSNAVISGCSECSECLGRLCPRRRLRPVSRPRRGG